MITETFSEKETRALGEELGRQAVPGSLYTLTGDLGTGKTVFTQGFARGLGITEHVNSPTFTIVQEYDGDLEEMDEIGYEDYFYGDGVCLIEWAELIEELLPLKRTAIRIEKDLEKGFDYRKITVEEIR